MTPIFEVFQYEFFVRAFVAAVFIGIALPMLGVLLVLRRLSLFADTMSHVALAGVAVSTLFSFAPIYIGMATSIVASSTLEELRLRNRLPSDAILALLLYGSLAFNLIIFSLRSATAQLTEFLFGNIYAISDINFILIVIVMALVIIFVLGTLAEISQIAFNDELARTGGVKVNIFNRLLAILTGAAIVVAMFAVGVLLVGALLVVPALVALRQAKGILPVILTASGVGLSSAVIGFVVAYYLETPISGTFAIIAIGMLIVSETLAFLVRQGLFNRISWRGMQRGH